MFPGSHSCRRGADDEHRLCGARSALCYASLGHNGGCAPKCPLANPTRPCPASQAAAPFGRRIQPFLLDAAGTCALGSGHANREGAHEPSRNPRGRTARRLPGRQAVHPHRDQDRPHRAAGRLRLQAPGDRLVRVAQGDPAARRYGRDPTAARGSRRACASRCSSPTPRAWRWRSRRACARSSG